jgi:hypothetical protein
VAARQTTISWAAISSQIGKGVVSMRHW